MSGICLNEDNSNFFISFSNDAMTQDALENHAYAYARGQVQHVLFCPNAQRASFGSSVIEPIWEGVDTDTVGRLCYQERVLNPNMENWIKNARTLHEKGIDPYQVWINAVRQCGRDAWLSCRMNDLHAVYDSGNVMHDAFWREHPDFQRAPYDGSIFGKGLDFSLSEVRDYKLAFIAELLERYDLDGIELDWLRFPAFLKPGYELDDAPLITEFMRQVRELANQAGDRWHHSVNVAVRLPGRPEYARRLGFDFLTWVKEDLMDEVTVSNFWPTTDFDMPLELWKGMLGPSIVLNAGLEINAQAYPGAPMMVHTPEMLAAFASQYLYRGADTIYLFNHMNGNTGLHCPDTLRHVLDTMGEEDTVYPQPRRHIMTYCVPNAEGMAHNGILPTIPGTTWKSFRMNVGGGTSSRCAYAVFGFQDEQPPQLQVLLNGEPCEHEDEAMLLPCPDNVTSLAIFAIPSRALHDGDNVVQFKLDDEAPKQIVWFEIYLP